MNAGEMEDETGIGRAPPAHWDWREELGDLGEDEVAALIGMLADEDVRVRWKAAWALGHLGDPRAVEPLIAVIDFSRPSVPGEDEFLLNMVAAWALGRLADRRAVDSLLPALAGQCSDYVWIAAWALGEIGDPRAIRPLEEALAREDFECVWSAGADLDEDLFDHADLFVLAYLTTTTFRDPVSPVARALEKLGVKVKGFGE